MDKTQLSATVEGIYVYVYVYDFSHINFKFSMIIFINIDITHIDLTSHRPTRLSFDLFIGEFAWV